MQGESRVLPSQVLADLEQGEVERRLAAELERVAGSVARTQKPGKLTIELKVEPKGEGIVITCAHKAAVPEFDPVGRLYYVSADGRLVSRNPDQGGLFDAVQPAADAVLPAGYRKG